MQTIPTPSPRVSGTLSLLIAAVAFLLTVFSSQTAYSQCNPSGNPSRYEYDITPLTMFNMLGEQFCTSQDLGTNCCGMQNSYRCLDIVLNLSEGPQGQDFSESCQGMFNFTTAQGNFDALYFNVGTPDPGGNGTNCNTPIMLGNNFNVVVDFQGTAMGTLEVELSVYDNMGVLVYDDMQVASAGQSVIFTICKPGFGCLQGGELIFGCCAISGTLNLAPGAPAAICAGGSTNLKVAGIGGLPPYTATIRSVTNTDTSYFEVLIPNDNDGNSGMDMIQFPVSPDVNTTYTMVSIMDAQDCVQPVMDAVQVSVSPAPIVYAGPDQVICPTAQLDLVAQGAFIQANGSGVTTGTWVSSGTGSFQPTALFPGATTYIPSAADISNGSVTLNLVSDDPAGPCAPAFDAFELTFHSGGGMVCDDLVTVSLDAYGLAEITPDMILEGTYDPDFYSVELYLNNVYIGTTLNCSHIGLTIRAKVIDICTGNSCQGFIQVVDFLAPQISCTDLFVSCVLMGDFSPAALDALGIAGAYPTVDENCINHTLNHADVWVTLPCNGSFNGQQDLSGYVVRTWTATDASGNQSICTQYLYFSRLHVGDVLFPADVNVSCANGNTHPSSSGYPYLIGFGQNWPLDPNSPVCGLQVSYTDQVLPVCDGTRQVLRTWTVYDPCLPSAPNQNPKFHVQVVSVVDNQGPVFNCPGNSTVNTNPLDCTGSPDLPDVLIEDACSRIASFTAQYVVGGITQTLNGALTGFPGNNPQDPDTLGVMGIAANLPLGPTQVTYTATDNCGNSSSCVFTVTVADLTPPTVACDEITQVSLGANGEVFVNATTFDDGSYDNCSNVYFKARRVEANGCQPVNRFFDQVKFCCSDLGDTIEVILRVYDVVVPAGEVSLTFEEDHANDCSVQVYVDDNIKPVCQAPAHVTVSCENFDPSLWVYGAGVAADNCCVDTITTAVNYALFDTLCSKGTITRTFRVFDCVGNSSQCTQRIVVEYEQEYYVRFPDDQIISDCDGTGTFGEPLFFGEDCELLATSYQDEIFTVVPDACYKIERTWRVINWCTFNPNLSVIQVPNPNPNATSNHPSNLPGPIVSPVQTPGDPWKSTVVKIHPNDPVATNYSMFWDADANGYAYKQIIKVIDNAAPVVADCPSGPVEIDDLTPNDPTLWNASYWQDATTGSNDLCEAPADIQVTATDLCGGAQVTVQYLLFLDLDGNGTMETVVSSTNIPPANTVYFNNAGNPNFSGGEARAFDQRAVSSNQKYRFNIDVVRNGDDAIAKLIWDTPAQPANLNDNILQGVTPQLPYGMHKIKWIISDGCGNETVCEYAILVQDGAEPTVVCINGLSVNIMPGGMISLFAPDFLQHMEDNCTPTGMLDLAIVESDLATGVFPVDPQGNPLNSVNFDCSELGTQAVQLWARDLAGNADFCETYVIVQDNAGHCGSDPISVAGALKTEAQDGLEGASVELSGSHPALPPVSMFQLSDPAGVYQFQNALPLAADYTIAPHKDDDPMNGVTTWDLVLISKHILGLEPLNSPYKMIAADANQSNSITTFDIVEFRKLILGIYNELPNNTSWRFVDKSFAFPDPANPFTAPFPEQLSVSDVQASQTSDDFTALKVGDVNGSAIAGSLMSADERNTELLLFDLDDRVVTAGELFSLDIQAAWAVAGFQFTLNLEGLEVLDIEPGAGMSADHFGIFPEALTTSFNGENKGAFTMHCRAKTDGRISDMIRVSSRITKAEAYMEGAHGVVRADVALRFDGERIEGAAFELYQNIPNPFISRTTVGFQLPEAAEATLTLFDETGRVLYQHEGSFAKGYNAVSIDRTMVRTSGLLYYKLEGSDFSATRKMILMD